MNADIYAIGPDGKGYRKITNAPNHRELARYPKGMVTVTVRNEQPVWKQSQASSGVFFVYVVGANEPQAVTLLPGSSKTLLFKSGDGIELFGAFRPTWRADGSQLSYRSGLCVTSSISAQPKPGEFVFKPLFSGEQPSGAHTARSRRLARRRMDRFRAGEEVERRQGSGSLGYAD